MILQNFKPVLLARKMVDFPNRIRYLPQVTAQLMVYSVLRSIFQQKIDMLNQFITKCRTQFLVVTNASRVIHKRIYSCMEWMSSHEELDLESAASSRTKEKINEDRI